jgi:predicted RNA-binding protein YlqC (UPF0109 family)
MKDLVASLARAPVGKPEKTLLAETEELYTSMFVLRAAKGDSDRTIAKQYRTVRDME